jgi:hypothetical protein
MCKFLFWSEEGMLYTGCFWVVGATLFYQAHNRTRMEKTSIMITAAIEPTI